MGMDTGESAVHGVIDNYLAARRSTEGYSVWIGYTYIYDDVKPGESVGRWARSKINNVMYEEVRDSKTHKVFGGQHAEGLSQPAAPDLAQ